MIPVRVWWQGELADAHLRYLARVSISPKRQQRAPWWFGGVWDMASQRPGTVPTRQMRAAVKAVDFTKGKGRKPNIRLIFDLARWGVKKGAIPKKSLAHYIDDFELFDILRLNSEIPVSGAYFLGDLPGSAILNLEKRLHHQWPLVQKIIDVVIVHQQPLIAANAARRKCKPRQIKPVKSILSTLLGV